MLRYDLRSLGEFQNDCGNWYTYRNTKDEWAIRNGLFYELDTIDGVRFCNPKKTVVYVAIDEAADGTAVIEKWKLKKHNQFNVY